MTNITIQLTRETEHRLRLQAGLHGESLETYLRRLAEREACGTEMTTDMLGQGVQWLSNRSADEIGAARQRILRSSSSPQDIPDEKTLFDVVEGAWPGTETDEEIKKALERMS